MSVRVFFTAVHTVIVLLCTTPKLYILYYFVLTNQGILCIIHIKSPVTQQHLVRNANFSAALKIHYKNRLFLWITTPIHNILPPLTVYFIHNQRRADRRIQ